MSARGQARPKSSDEALGAVASTRGRRNWTSCGASCSPKGRIRLAIIAPHFVQYHSPLYWTLSADGSLDVTVLYLDDLGRRPAYDKEFNHSPVWDAPTACDYQYKLLINYGSGASMGFFSRVNLGLLRELDRARYDVVLVQGYSNFSYWLAVAVARLKGIKVIWRGEVTGKRGEDQKSVKARVKRALRTGFLRQADAIMFTCEGNKLFLIDHGFSGGTLHQFPCAVDNAHFRKIYDREKPQRSSIRHALGIGDHELVVAFCGRLIQRKRPMDLLRAVARLGPGAAITLLVIGDGPQRDELERFSRAHGLKVTFVGFVAPSELGRYYAISDAFALISEYDPSPKALNEIMNFEVAVIVSRIVGTSADLVEAGKNGFIVEAGDVEGIAARIQKLLEDRPLCRAMGRYSAEKVLNFSYQHDLNGLKGALKALGIMPVVELNMAGNQQSVQ